MDRERARAFGVGATLLALCLIALLAVDASHEESEPPTRAGVQRPARPRPLPAPAPVRQPPRARPRATAVARRFAGDWLDYLAARRPVSSVRGADPALLVAFASGESREALGPGRKGLRGVRCGPRRGGRRDCRAGVVGLPPLRFTVSVLGRPRVVALALD